MGFVVRCGCCEWCEWCGVMWCNALSGVVNIVW